MTAAAPIRHVDKCMVTVFSIDVRSPGCDPSALDDVLALLHEIDATFSTYRADSEISRLARHEIDLDDCGDDVRWVLDRCGALERDTSGFFSAHAAGSLDPSGLVKGWAIERASDLLAAAGSANHCVNGGGDVQCAGEASPGTPWRVGVAHPLRPGQIAAVVQGRDIAVATSGTSERGAHIVDPHTGLAPGAQAGVTVVGRRLSTTDAYCTAAFAMGDAARGWLETLDGYSGFGVTSTGETWRTSAFGQALA